MRIKIRITTKEWFSDFAISYLRPIIIHVNVESENDTEGIINAVIKHVSKNLPKGSEITTIENLGENNVLVEKEEKKK